MNLLIVGASTRAAAHSALRAGISSIAIDLFADRDLAAIGPVSRIEAKSYPHGFEALSSGVPEVPWMYTGALENAADLIDRIASERPLWGIAGSSLRKIRDPFLLSDQFSQLGLFPEVRESAESLPRDGSWLVKPRNSAGGRAIRPWVETSLILDRPSYFQKRIDGPSLAAIFVGTDRGSTLLGITRQIHGHGTESFSYVGSIGPLPVSDRTREGIENIGTLLVRDFGLRGLFGVDGILRADDRFVMVEVNPRYTASIEVLELALGRSLLDEHRRAFESDGPRKTPHRIRPPAFVGKRILFAERRSTLLTLDSWRPRALGTFAVQVLADIPEIGTVFEPGDPVLTVLAKGSTLEGCQTRLERRLERWKSRLQPVD